MSRLLWLPFWLYVTATVLEAALAIWLFSIGSLWLGALVAFLTLSMVLFTYIEYLRVQKTKGLKAVIDAVASAPKITYEIVNYKDEDGTEHYKYEYPR